MAERKHHRNKKTVDVYIKLSGFIVGIFVTAPRPNGLSLSHKCYT